MLLVSPMDHQPSLKFCLSSAPFFSVYLSQIGCLSLLHHICLSISPSPFSCVVLYLSLFISIGLAHTQSQRLTHTHALKPARTYTRTQTRTHLHTHSNPHALAHLHYGFDQEWTWNRRITAAAILSACRGFIRFSIFRVCSRLTFSSNVRPNWKWT